MARRKRQRARQAKQNAVNFYTNPAALQSQVGQFASALASQGNASARERAQAMLNEIRRKKLEEVEVPNAKTNQLNAKTRERGVTLDEKIKPKELRVKGYKALVDGKNADTKVKTLDQRKKEFTHKSDPKRLKEKVAVIAANKAPDMTSAASVDPVTGISSQDALRIQRGGMKRKRTQKSRTAYGETAARQSARVDSDMKRKKLVDEGKLEPKIRDPAKTAHYQMVQSTIRDIVKIKESTLTSDEKRALLQQRADMMRDLILQSKTESPAPAVGPPAPTTGGGAQPIDIPTLQQDVAKLKAQGMDRETATEILVGKYGEGVRDLL